jgi:hypothetical protein
MTLRDYLAASKAPRYSLLFALALLVAYEVTAFLVAPSSGVRNGADVVLKWLFVWLGGGRGLLVFNLLLIGIGTVLVVRDWRQPGKHVMPRVFLAMLAESAVLAVLVGMVVGRATQALMERLAIGQMADFSTGTQLMLSLGAGIYEELLFRVLLVGGLAWLFRKGLGWSPAASGVVACVAGALIFSGFHYIGAYGDPWQLGSFTFRALAGLVFSALYLTRGLGITAWTHALYDVYVTIL